MKQFFTFSLFLFFCTPKISAQNVMDPFRSFFSVGGGFSYASINNWQENTKLRLNPGVRGIIGFQLSELFNIEASSTVFLKHNSSPAFVDIHAWNMEFNGNIMIPMSRSGYFRVQLGTAYLDWKGFYSGVGLHGRPPYHKGDLLHYKFIEGNIGMGFTQHIGNRCFLDFTLLMRVSAEEKRYGLSDTSLQFGFRFAPKFKKTPKSISETDSKNKQTKTENGIPRGKYKWLKKKR